MKATNWYRRHVEAWREGQIHVSAHFIPAPVQIQINVQTYVGDAVERCRIELDVDEARKLRDSLTRMLDGADQRGGALCRYVTMPGVECNQPESLHRSADHPFTWKTGR